MFNKLKTKNYQLTAKRRGFTLMEILISASIFAIIMIIATGVFGQSSSYRGKIKAMREVNEDSKTIADQITRDVRTANSEAVIKIGEIGESTMTHKNGLVLMKGYATSRYSFWRHDLMIPPTPIYDANILVIATKDKYKVYYSPSAPNSQIYYFSINRLNAADGTINTLDCDDIVNRTVPAQVISNANNNTVIKFTGFAPHDEVPINAQQQPFISFDIISKTKNYDTLPVNQRAQTEIRSSVTARSFKN